MATLDVFPTTDRVDEALASEALPGPTGVGGVFLRRAMTFRQLEEVLVRAGVGTGRRLTDAGRSLALSAVLARGPSTLFGAVAAKPGFRRAVEGFIRELAVGACEPTRLAAVSAALPGALGDKVRALAAIVRAYADGLETLGLVDPAFALGAACAALEAGGELPADLSGFQHVRIRDVVDWPPARLTVVRALGAALARRGGRVEVELPRSERTELADIVEPAWQALESIPVGVELRERAISLPPPGQVTAFDAATEETQARELAVRVRRLLAQGVPPSQIGVVACGMAELAPALVRTLELAGIPVRHRRGLPLVDAVVIKLALAFCRLEGPTAAGREAVAALLGSGLVDLRGLYPDAPFPSAMVGHLRAARVRDRTREDGVDGYTARLEKLARAHDHGGEPKAGAEARRVIGAVCALFDRFDAWPATTTIRRHGRELLRLMQLLRVGDRLRRVGFDAGSAGVSHPDVADRMQSACLAHEQAAWARLPLLLSDLSEAARAVGLSEAPVTRAAFARWLADLASAENLRPGSARGVAVELLELADLAGRKVPHLFVVGAYDGRLPGPSDGDPLLTDDERWRLNAALGRPVFRVSPRGAERSPFPSRQLVQAFAYALALESAEFVTLGRPRMDGRGRPLGPSPLLSLVAPSHEDRIAYAPLDDRHRSGGSEGVRLRRTAQDERARFFATGRASAFAGDVSALHAALAPWVPGTAARPLSAAGAERAANCRFRHFAEAILGARASPDDGDDAGAMETGRLAHLAAEQAVKAITGAGLWRLDRVDEAVSAGLAAAGRALDEEEPRTVLGDPAVWQVSREKLVGRLARLIPLEIQRTAAAGLRPTAFEFAFGGRDGQDPPLEFDGLHLAGKIDRVDTGAAGALVLDYKSGATDANARKLREGSLLATQFQLPVYLLAARRLLGAGPSVDAAYVSFRDAGRSKTLLEAAGSGWDPLEERLCGALHAAVDALARADFAPSPVSCAGCHLRSVCRIPRPEAT